MSRIRHRKTINPFRFQRDVQRPDWAAMMEPDQSVEVDLGFGRGEFMLEMAERRPDVFFVGLELRDYLIEKVQEQIAERSLTNVHVMAANVKVQVTHMRAAVERHNDDGSVIVLVAVRTKVSNSDAVGQEQGYRLRVTMAPDRGRYKIDKIDQVTS